MVFRGFSFCPTPPPPPPPPALTDRDDALPFCGVDHLHAVQLVYLYLMNYSKTNPDLAILAVNSFCQDSQDHNPLIRALAIRTMGCIRVDKITEYLCEPLRRCLKDDDPYVRKTAAVCVAKLYDINPELVEDQGFVDSLKDLMGDPNPMVVANTIAALSEIVSQGGSDVGSITANNLQKLNAALNECTEWGQVFILDALAQYTPASSREAENIVERVVARLNHANAAVVLSAVKVIMKFMDVIDNADFVRSLFKKLAPSLVTLLSRESEVQYVALRNINLIVQKQPTILQHEIKVFFCKYNDPIYVKLEKLEIMIRLVTERNVDQVLLEFKEYATEVDVDFVRKSVRAIGRCAIKLEKTAERCISVLLDLIQTKVNYVVQEAIVVIKDIFRRYPNRYESIIAPLCESLDTLDEPEAKASMIWIIGEYAERIENADELLDSFIESFHDEPSGVQLQLVTATVKLFLKKPNSDGARDMIQKVLTLATQHVDNPDLRDRAYVYWRLLSTDPEKAKAVVLADKPVISDNSNQLDNSLLNRLMTNLGTLASVYHKPPETFVSKMHVAVPKHQQVDLDSESDDDAVPAEQRSSAAAVNQAAAAVDLLGLDNGPPAQAAATPQARVNKVEVVDMQKGKGMIVHAGWSRKQGQAHLELTINNQSGAPLSQFAIQFNKNSFNLAPAAPINIDQVANGQTVEYSLPCAPTGQQREPPASAAVQMAMKNNTGHVAYFESHVDLTAVLVEDNAGGKLEKSEFLGMWKQIPDANERTKVVQPLASTSADAVVAALQAARIHLIARRSPQPGQDVVYFSAKTVTNAVFLAEITLQQGQPSAKLCTKTVSADLAVLFENAVEAVLKPAGAASPQVAQAADPMDIFGAPVPQAAQAAPVQSAPVDLLGGSLI